ncbi:MAG: GAF domain-containing sensor histidine kinase, partial [Anaerolineae bacterium]|nr:GAF domain-containing sensor histidine kinase [Anaerolineae bacterium]
FYGLAFFSMGLAVMLESRRTSEFRMAGAMMFLAGFGLLHGVHEWTDMFVQLGKFESLSPEQAFLFNGLRIGELVFSFSLLIVFGIRLITSNRTTNGRENSFAWIVAGILAAFWFVSVLLTRWIYNPPMAEFVISADVLARYIVGIPGALLAAWAIVLEQRAFKERGMPDFGRALFGAAIALTLYGIIGQLFVTPSFLFPANIINGELFFELFGFPVQLFRAVTAVIIAIFIIQALRAFEVETRQQLLAANDARLLAQRDALFIQEQAQRETEAINQDLEQAVQELSILYELSRNLAATIDRDTLLQQTTAQVFDTLPRIGGGMVLLRDKPGRPLKIVARSGYVGRGQTNPDFECPYDRAYLLGQYVANTGHLAWCDGENIVDLGDATLVLTRGLDDPIQIDIGGHTIGVPLLAQQQVVGSVVFSVKQNIAPFTQRDLSLIVAIAGQLSIAIENASLYQEVQERETMRGELLQQVVGAQENERQRIARELHDSTGQSLTALGLGLAAVSDSLYQNVDVAAAQVKELRALNSQTLQDVHELVADLRPSLLDNLGLVSALRSQAQAFQKRTGIHITFTHTGEKRREDSTIELTLYRIAQEGLTNVAKHAQASEVRIRLISRPDRLCLRIRDNGRGFDTEKALDSSQKHREAWGLLGMQERVSLIGGHFFIRSRQNVGTIIQICIPLPEK